MIDALIFISRREIVIALALIGALIATVGSYLERAESGGARNDRGGTEGSRFRKVTLLGYGVTALSVLLFIIAGFVSDLRP